MEQLRKEVSQIDARLLELLARRAEVAEEIGRVKSREGLPTRDPAREKQVRAAFVRNARRLGLDDDMATDLAGLLIGNAVRIQQRKPSTPLRRRSALVVGGSGRMGSWTARFLANRGATVNIWDPRGSLPGYSSIKSLRTYASESDLTVIASPLGVAAEELRAVLDSSPKGLVFDVCSIKGPLVRDIRSASKAGIRITSVHPMFGPSVASPRGRNVIVCHCGCPGADREVSSLFTSAGANITMTGLERHDELMAYVIGLPHLCMLAFASAVTKSKIPLEELERAQGPSFERLSRSARELSRESRRVYHDIQLLNPESKAMISTLESALHDLKTAALADDPKAFREIMDRCEEYL